MNREEIIAICHKAKDVGTVKHEDFIDYIMVLQRRHKVGDEWKTTEHAYMGVDGKIAMAAADHRNQDKHLEIEPPIVMVDSENEITLTVVITSEIYGKRCGTATSHRKTGGPTERSNPWETAETSAIGRALSGFGYGLLPGAGLASAEDVIRSATAPARAPRTATAPPPAVPSARPDGTHPINSPVALLAAVSKVTDYYNDESQVVAMNHLRGAIQKQVGNAKWSWPNAKALEDWKEGYVAALQYAQAQSEFGALGTKRAAQ